METTYLEMLSKEPMIVRHIMIDPDIARAEHLLAEAGIGFTEVDRCPATGCEVCDATPLDAAA